MRLTWNNGNLVMELLQPIDYYGQNGMQPYKITLDPNQVEQLRAEIEMDFISRVGLSTVSQENIEPIKTKVAGILDPGGRA